MAVARRTDPSTSWEAARSVRSITENQNRVLMTFWHEGPFTDEDGYAMYRRIWTEHPQSVSGFRTRRSELVKAGLLRDTGQRKVGSTGRKMIVWEAT